MWTQTWTATVRDCTLLYIVNLSNYMIMVNQIINRILVQFCFFDWSSELRNTPLPWESILYHSKAMHTWGVSGELSD